MPGVMLCFRMAARGVLRWGGGGRKARIQRRRQQRGQTYDCVAVLAAVRVPQNTVVAESSQITAPGTDRNRMRRCHAQLHIVCSWTNEGRARCRRRPVARCRSQLRVAAQAREGDAACAAKQLVAPGYRLARKEVFLAVTGPERQFMVDGAPEFDGNRRRGGGGGIRARAGRNVGALQPRFADPPPSIEGSRSSRVNWRIMFACAALVR